MRGNATPFDAWDESRREISQKTKNVRLELINNSG